MLPSGCLTVRHGKSPFLIGKPTISMGHLYHGYVKKPEGKTYVNPAKKSNMGPSALSQVISGGCWRRRDLLGDTAGGWTKHGAFTMGKLQMVYGIYIWYKFDGIWGITIYKLEPSIRSMELPGS